MKVERLQVQNFRRFEQGEWTFTPQVNVIVGENGAGKTALLDALAFGLGAFVRYLNDQTSRFQPDDARRVSYDKNGVPVVEPQYPVVVQIAACRNENSEIWTRAYAFQRRTSPLNDTSFALQTRQIREQVQKGENIALPLLAYYGCRRLCFAEFKNKRTLSFGSPESRLDGYNDALESHINQRAFLEWFGRLEFATLQRKEQFGILEGVRQAVVNSVQDAVHIAFDGLESELLLRFKDGRELPFRMLSDGYRNIISLSADIAYRAAVLNPQFEQDAPRHTAGIVLIDEIDLHLHPTWQRVVIANLIKTFPKMQFIVTTHSPFIIQSMEVSHQAQLINLDPDLATDFERKSIEDIAEENQGVEHVQRSRRYQEMVEAAEQYYQTLRQAQSTSPEKLEHLKRRLDELMMPFSDDPAYVALLEAERTSAGMGKGR